MIRVNNRNIDFRQGMTIQSLIEDLKYSFPTLIVRVNDIFIPKEQYKDTLIKDGDDIKIIHPIAGG